MVNFGIQALMGRTHTRDLEIGFVTNDQSHSETQCRLLTCGCSQLPTSTNSSPNPPKNDEMFTWKTWEKNMQKNHGKKTASTLGFHRRIAPEASPPLWHLWSIDGSWCHSSPHVATPQHALPWKLCWNICTSANAHEWPCTAECLSLYALTAN